MNNTVVLEVNQMKQTVVGGSDEDIAELEKRLSNDYPRKKSFKIKTEGAFHTSLMIKAAEEFKQCLSETEFKEMNAPVLSNFSSKMHKNDGSKSSELLYNQLFKPVNWLGCMETASKMEVEIIIEFGGGIGEGVSPNEKRPNLEGITKKNFRNLKNEVTYLPAINASTIKEASKINYQ